MHVNALRFECVLNLNLTIPHNSFNFSYGQSSSTCSHLKHLLVLNTKCPANACYLTDLLIILVDIKFAKLTSLITQHPSEADAC